MVLSYATPIDCSTNTPVVTVTLASKVVSAIMFAAMRSLPPRAFTITKLAAAVGLAKNRNMSPSSRPSKPASQATSVHRAGKDTIFQMDEPMAGPLSLRMDFSDTVAPIQSRARGRVSEAK